MSKPPPFLARPYPLDEYLDQLDRDYERIAVRLLRASNWEAGTSRCGRFKLDAGEALIDERSEALWGGLRLDRDVTADGLRALVRRVLERLARDGWISLRDARTGQPRAAHARGPRNGPSSGPRNGPSPTVVRFLKFREILWPASAGSAQETAQGSAQETAPANGPILPEKQPVPPSEAAARASAAEPAHPEGDAAPVAAGPPAWPLAASFRRALTESMARTVLYPVGGRDIEVWTSLEASLRLIPEAEAVEICRERILAAIATRRRQPGTLAYFAQVLADEVLRRQSPRARRVGDLGVDHSRKWWEGLSREQAERFLAERREIDPALDDSFPFWATGAHAPGDVQALIDRWAHVVQEPLRAAAGV